MRYVHRHTINMFVGDSGGGSPSTVVVTAQVKMVREIVEVRLET